MIFGDSVELSKNAWYMKMLRFMWGTGWEKFNNLCPLFWSVVLSILVFPLWIIIRPFFKTSIKFWGIIGKTIAILGCIWMALMFDALMGVLFVYPFLIWKEGGIWDEWTRLISIIGMVFAGVVIVIFGAIVVIDTKDEDIRLARLNTKTGRALNGLGMFLEWLITPILWIFTPFKWIYELVKLVCSFLYYDFYKKNCPYINWK